jgi:hypothetical protein
MKTKQLLLTLLMAFLMPLAVNAQNIYAENFDSYTVGSSVVTPTDWTVTTSGTGVYATVINANAYSNPNSFLMGNPSALTANRSVVAVLPTFDLLNLNCTKLTFRVKSSSASMGDNTLSVGYTYSDLSGDHTQVLQTCNASTSYTEVTLSFNLSAVPNNARIFFRYNGKRNAPAQTYWYIDNIVVSNDLQAPTDLTVTDVTASTAELSWTMNGHGNAHIMYSTQSDFSDPQYSTTGSLTGLEGYTTYYAKVRARARKDATSMWFNSPWSDPVEFTTLCPTPTNLYLYSDPVQGVTASWDGNASVYNLKYESMESVFNYYNGMVCANGNSYTFTGSETVPLEQGMKYRFSVQAQCEPTMASDWSDWVVFADCPTYLSLPLHQKFDYIPVSTTNTDNNIPGCWMYDNNSTAPEYQSYPRIENNESLCYSNYYPEGQYNYIRFNMPVNGANQSLIFPAIDPVSTNGVTLSFWVRSVSSETATNFIVGLMDQTLDINNIYRKQHVNRYSTSYEQMSFTFTYEELVQHGSYIVIKAPASSNYPVSFCIDDIDIYPADYHCDEPVNVHVENLNMNSAVIVWQNPESGGGEWGFKYKKETDAEWTVVYETGLLSTHYAFDYLDLGTTYNVAVINNCNDIDHSEWVEYSFTTPGYTPVPINVAIDNEYYGNSWVEFTWECSYYTGQYAVESYEIQLDSNPIEPCSVLYYKLNVIEKGQHTFRVRAIDDQGNTGDWSETLSFVIEGCDDPVDIDSEHSAYYSFSPFHLPDCWTVTGRPDKFDVGSSLRLMVDENYETYVELPKFNIADSDYDGLKVSFDWQQLPAEWDNGTVAGVQVQYSDNGTQWSDADDFISLYGDDEYMQYVYCSRNIPAPYPTVYVRLKFVVDDYHDFGEYPPQCILDNLRVIGQSLCGDIPTDLHVIDGYPANQQVFLSWTAGNDEQTEWQIAISKNSNSNWQITSPFTSEDCTMGFNVDHNSTYHVKVRAYCDTNHHSGWSEEIVFTTPYFGKTFTGAEDNLWSNANNWTGGIPSEEDDVLLQADVTVTGEAEAYNLDLGGFTITVENGGILNANAFIGENANNPLKTVIKDGGQVKSNTPFVAVIEKNITGYGAENVDNNSGYYLITPPTYLTVAEGNVIPREDYTPLYDQIDFYWFNGDNQDEEWYNPKEANGMIDGRTMLSRTKGYLYARQNDGTLSFEASSYPSSNDLRFQATNENISVGLSSYSNSTAPFNGWNLIGNPFTCNAYLLDENGNIMPFYRMNDAGNAIVGAQPGTAIKPCEGVFVFCPNDGEAHYAVFTTTAPATVGEVQNDLVVALPTHNLIGNQPASISALTQTIALAEGVNWVSFYVETSLADVQNALTVALGTIQNNQILQIQSQTKNVRFTRGRWMGELSSLDFAQTYMITVPSDCEIMVEGVLVNPAEHPITLVPGANWIGYPVNATMTLNEAFGSSSPVNNDIVQSQEKNSIRTRGQWRGELGTLQPGKGYMYQSASTEERTFTFPASSGKKVKE